MRQKNQEMGVNFVRVFYQYLNAGYGFRHVYTGYVRANQTLCGPRSATLVPLHEEPDLQSALRHAQAEESQK